MDETLLPLLKLKVILFSQVYVCPSYTRNMPILPNMGTVAASNAPRKGKVAH